MKFNVDFPVLELSGVRKMDNLPALCCAVTTTNTTTQQNNMSANHRKGKQKKTDSNDKFNQAMQAHETNASGSSAHRSNKPLPSLSEFARTRRDPLAVEGQDALQINNDPPSILFALEFSFEVSRRLSLKHLGTIKGWLPVASIA